jgi:3alpha(or 20beta)-hydroxysteroid dehydrogenase
MDRVVSGGRVVGRVIVVTGAAGGQGAAETDALVAEGASVIAADLSAPESRDGVVGVALDVADPDGWAAVAALARERFGRVDGLINNAGVTSRVRIGDVTPQELRRVLDINVAGAVWGIQALLPLMGEGASIVNVGSLAGLTGHYTVPYTTSKWALRGLTHACAMELGPRGIRVNAVHPGYIETPMTATAPAPFLAANVAVTPLGRPGQPEEVVQQGPVGERRLVQRLPAAPAADQVHEPVDTPEALARQLGHRRPAIRRGDVQRDADHAVVRRGRLQVGGDHRRALGHERLDLGRSLSPGRAGDHDHAAVHPSLLHHAVQPPSTLRVVPVTELDASQAR